MIYKNYKVIKWNYCLKLILSLHKESMKKLKRWLAALLIGEFVTLWHKDEQFKNNIQEAKNPLDKVKIVFDWLFNFNKKVIQDIQQTNFEKLKIKAINRFDKEKILLDEKLTHREDNLDSRSQEKAPIYLMGLEDQFEKFKKKASAWKERIIEEYDLEETIALLQKRIENARNDLTQKKDSV